MVVLRTHMVTNRFEKMGEKIVEKKIEGSKHQEKWKYEIRSNEATIIVITNRRLKRYEILALARQT